MAKLTENLTIRIDENLSNYLAILEDKYKIKKGDFIRKAIINQMKIDVPILRKELLKQQIPF
jgi:hypothetical protein